MKEETPAQWWEFVVWAVVMAVGLIVIHAAIQATVNRANDSHVWTTPPPATTTVCSRAGCFPR